MYNQEIKGNLAKLLATENLVVEHRDVSTASFDVDRRVLTLPNWDKASSIVYDMLVGHEVGHALFTPNEDWTENANIPVEGQGFVNVIEDVRIEKLMKRKYAGLRKSFAGGYAELNALDFFEIKDKDLNKFSLIDRINLHFKVGVAALIPFTDTERDFVTRAENTETFDEVLKLAKELWDREQLEQKQKEEVPCSDSDETGSGIEGNQQSSNEDNNKDESDTESEYKTSKGQSSKSDSFDDSEEGDDEDGDVFNQGGKEAGSTQESLDSKLRSLTSHNYGSNTTYVEIPASVDLDKVLVDWKDVVSWIEECNKDEKEHYDYATSYSDVDKFYKEFRNANQKEVNYLVKEFECKKSADAYARTSTSRTGMLDMKNLHTYKYNEDLFKRINVIPDGKNHGLIFILDWSGSMQYELLATVKQLLNLTAFCKKVQIPFEVYAFTNEWQIVERSKQTGEPDFYSNWYGNSSYSRKEKLVKNEIVIGEGEFHLVNFISSRSNSKEYEKQCRYLFREAYCYRNHCGYRPTPGLGLSGTPLNEAVIMLNYILPVFQRNNDLQKVNVCILTDGEACTTAYGRECKSYQEPDAYVGIGRLHDGCQLRDRKTGRIYPTFSDWYGNTSIFINQVRDRFPNVNVLGFRILPGKKLSEFVGRYGTYEHYEEVQKQWKKTKSAIIPFPKGYSALYAISSKDLEEETTFDVEEGAKKGAIIKAFKKTLKSKSANKILLNSFVDHVA